MIPNGTEQHVTEADLREMSDIIFALRCHAAEDFRDARTCRMFLDTLDRIYQRATGHKYAVALERQLDASVKVKAFRGRGR